MMHIPYLQMHSATYHCIIYFVWNYEQNKTSLYSPSLLGNCHFGTFCQGLTKVDRPQLPYDFPSLSAAAMVKLDGPITSLYTREVLWEMGPGLGCGLTKSTATPI
ncbi:hypothetical protein SAY86_024316 [Trapa natans]|uniref:Uncharacterized protein n=1 Tax=Trapa natans TaxID=22666 RepID=A0AAN7MPQ4_TRANT|nr:hypothetical protein SAY86_024316 [Trapa natans]